MSENINDKLASAPTTPEPKAEPTAAPKDDAAALLETLKELGVDNPEKLQGMAVASQQTGKAWNEVGSLRKQIDEMQALLRQQQTPQKSEPHYDPYADGQSIDLGQLVESKVEKTIERFWEKQQRMQNEANERWYREMSEVKGDSRFKAVEKMFDAHINSPETTMRLRNGQTNLKQEYNNLLLTYYDTLLSKAYNTMSGVAQKTAKPPHVESGNTQAVPMQASDDDRTEAIKKTTKGRQDGSLNSNDALQKIVETFLPKDDPMWST